MSSFRDVLVTSVFAVAAFPTFADGDCQIGEVLFETSGVEQILTLHIHEQGAEVALGLFQFDELPEFGGVLAVYPEPRDGRNLANSNKMAADLASFSEAGSMLVMLEDQTGNKPDYMPSGDGMKYAVYLEGGTIAAKGFNSETRLVEWHCIDDGS